MVPIGSIIKSAEKMGIESRKMVEDKFDVHKVN